MSNQLENNTTIMMICVHSVLGYWTSNLLFISFLPEYEYLLNGSEFIPFVLFGTLINMIIYVSVLNVLKLFKK